MGEGRSGGVESLERENDSTPAHGQEGPLSSSGSVSMHRPEVAGDLTHRAETVGSSNLPGDTPSCITDSEGTTYLDARETRNEAKASSQNVNTDVTEASMTPGE